MYRHNRDNLILIIKFKKILIFLLSKLPIIFSLMVSIANRAVNKESFC